MLTPRRRTLAACASYWSIRTLQNKRFCSSISSIGTLGLICVPSWKTSSICVVVLVKQALHTMRWFWVQWVHEDTNRLSDAVRAAGLQTQFVFLQIGRRKIARTDSQKGIYLDVNPLRRSAFNSALAIAAGREHPEEYFDAEVKHMKSSGKLLSVEAARTQNSLILVAEDDAVNRNLIERQLTLLGYTCVLVMDGKQALEAWRRNAYALLLTDCNMPHMDGFKLTREIRQEEVGSNVRARVIGLTANALEGEAERCLEGGMDDYLSKPIALKDLREILGKWLPAAKEECRPEENSLTTYPINESTLKDMFGDDPDIFKKIFIDFVEPSNNIIQEILSGCDKHSTSAIGDDARQLKSAAYSVGAMELGDLCKEIEEAGERDDWGVIDAGAPKLAKLISQVEGHFSALEFAGSEPSNKESADVV